MGAVVVGEGAGFEVVAHVGGRERGHGGVGGDLLDARGLEHLGVLDRRELGFDGVDDAEPRVDIAAGGLDGRGGLVGAHAFDDVAVRHAGGLTGRGCPRSPPSTTPARQTDRSQDSSGYLQHTSIHLTNASSVAPVRVLRTAPLEVGTANTERACVTRCSGKV